MANQFEFSFDEQVLLNKIDDMLANLSENELLKIKQENIKQGLDTDIIDKAIQNHRKKKELLNQKQEKERLKEIAHRKRMRKVFFASLLGAFFNNSKNKSTADEYEPYQFEEKEMEDDDFYFDDDIDK